MNKTNNLLRGILPRPLICIGYEQLTVTGAFDVLASIPATATYCEIRVDTAVADVALRYRLDGTAPTTSVGMPLTNLDLFDIDGAENIANFKVIATSSTSTLNIQYYK